MRIVWDRGRLPQQWKTANVILIPKPGKPPKLENLRPISLTSCIGKLMERVVQTRLTRFMELNDLWPHEMVGFRPGLCTQDVMLRLRHDIIESETRDARVLLGLDLTKAFDNVKHAAILSGLQELGVGKKTYDYVKDFLSGRTIKIKFQDIESSTVKLGSRGTPQGSVLSPFLFNVAMRNLPAELRKVENLKFSMYADDVNLWATQGSDASIEERLQAAADTVVSYAAERGLSCSPQKSELFIYNPKALRCKRQINISVTVDGQIVPKVEQIRILGLFLQADGYNDTTVKKLNAYATQVTGLFRRIALKVGALRNEAPETNAGLHH